MRSKKTFEVKNPPILSRMSMVMVLLCLAMAVVYVLTTPQTHPAILISIIVLFIIPFSIVWIWAKRYSIKVQGTSISLQRSFRAKPVCFEVTDITKAVCIIVETRTGRNVKFTVHTSEYGKFTVETLMINSDKMTAYLEEYADNKIQIVHKKIGL